MRHPIGFLLLGCSLLSADVVHKVVFEPSGLHLTRSTLAGVTYDVVRIDGGVVTAAPGQPAVPARPVHFVLGPDEEVVGVEVISVSTEDLPGEHILLPMQPFSAGEELSPPVGPEPNAYSSPDYVPSKLVESVASGNLAGYRVAGVLVYPMQYCSAQRRIRQVKEIEIRLVTRKAQKTGSRLVRRDEAASGFYAQLIKDLVVNPDDVTRCGPAPGIGNRSPGYAPTLRPSPEGSPVEYVIVTSSALSSVFQPLADWKTERGVPAAVRTTEWIYANYPGCDNAEKVRNFLKDAYGCWGTVWVLLGGDVDVVPHRNAYEPTSHLTWPLMACDYYFSDLDGTWNFNGNNLYGEIADSVDMYPDVFVGRAAVSNASQAQVFVGKVIGYEGAAAADYQNKILMMAAWVDRYTNCAVGKRDYIHRPLVPPHFQVSELYQRDYGLREGINRGLALDSLNRGFNIINQVDHTGIYTMGVGMSAGEILYRTDFDKLQNGVRTGIMFSCGCNVAAFNYDCIGEHFVSNPNGGGVAFIGSSRAAFLASGAPGLSPIEIYDQNFFEALLAKRTLNVGAALGLAKAKLSHLTRFITYYRYTHFALNLLGDPQTPVWTELPRRVAAAYPAVIPLEPGLFVVTVVDSNYLKSAPVSPFRVVLFKAGDFYRTECTDRLGQAFFNLAPEDTGRFSVVVTKENYVPFKGTATVVYSNQPRLCFYRHAIDDDSVPPSRGNGNGVIDAGEVIEGSLSLENRGNQTSTGFTSRIATSSPYVSISQPDLRFPAIEPGGHVTSDDRFVFEVHGQAPDHAVVFRIEPGPLDTFSVDLRAPVISHCGHIIDDRPPGGNGNGLVEPLETIWLYLKVRNSGQGVANQARAILQSIDTTIIVDPQGREILIGDVGPGQELVTQTAFKFYTTSRYLPKDRAQLTLVDNYGRIRGKEVAFGTILPPSAIVGSSSQSSVTLQWDSVPRAMGYHLYRKDSPSDTFQRVSRQVVTNAGHYEDKAGIGPLKHYYYQMTSMDSFFNESPRSTELVCHTNPPFLGGWPVGTGYEGGFNPSSPAIADVDGDGANEIAIGAGTKLFLWRHDGTVMPGWPIETNEFTAASPALADIDRDGRLEVIVGQSNNVYVYAVDGAVRLRLVTDGAVAGCPVVYDLDRDNQLDIIAQTKNNKLYAWHGDGTVFPAFPITLPGYPGYTSPAIGDLDEDGYMEIVSGFVKTWDPPCGGLAAYRIDGAIITGWDSITTNGTIYLSSPVIGDIDQDSSLEVVMGFVSSPSGNQVIAFKPDGRLSPGFPVRFDESVTGLALADLDQAAGLEIIAGLVGGYAVIKCDGTLLHRARFEGGVYSEPAVGDVDNDGRPEAIMSSFGPKLYGFDGGHGVVPYFPFAVEDGTFSAPVIWDADQDGQVDIGGAFLNASCKFWALGSSFDPARVEWHMNRHDNYRTGNYHVKLPQVSIHEWAGYRPMASRTGLLGVYVNPQQRKIKIAFGLARPGQIDIDLYDLCGRKLYHRNLVWVSGEHTLEIDARDFSAGVYFCRCQAEGRTGVRKFVYFDAR